MKLRNLFIFYKSVFNIMQDYKERDLVLPTFLTKEYNVIYRSRLDSDKNVQYDIHFERFNYKNGLSDSFKDLSRQIVEDKGKFFYFIDLLEIHTDSVLKEYRKDLQNGFYKEEQRLFRDAPSTSKMDSEQQITCIIDLETLKKEEKFYNYFIFEIKRKSKIQDLLRDILLSVINSENKLIIDFLDNEKEFKTERNENLLKRIFSLNHNSSKKSSKYILRIYLEFIRLKFVKGVGLH